MKMIKSAFQIVSIEMMVLATGYLQADTRLVPAANPASGKNVVAQKLRECDFLLNKMYKEDAKFYLCLFSASWCPPCRAEMPRIAKTYAETLKDDPDIELIHFSHDQNDEKALAWAKEHDVKFPVIKPKDGNPLDLHSRGIPHLFIVKADGTLLEEGHPMRIFNAEKFREIKSGNVKPPTADADLRDGERREQADGYTWTYRVENGGATIVVAGGKNGCTISPTPHGIITIPSKLGGVNVTSIGWRAFCGCDQLTSVTISSGVTNIGDQAFINCKALRSVTIPSSVKSIGDAAFWYCSGLSSITIPSSVTMIDDSAFMNCFGLTSVEIPAGVTRIGKGNFSGCKELMSINVSAANAYYCSIDGILYNKTRTELIQCPGGKSGGVSIPSGVTNICWRAFCDCFDVASVKIPEGVANIGEYMFGWCYSLKSVTIPSTVKSIERGAFWNCFNLRSVVIPSSVTSIGDSAFSACSALTSVTMRGERPEAGDKVFEGCEKLKFIHVPTNCKSWAGMKEWQGIPLVFVGSLEAAQEKRCSDLLSEKVRALQEQFKLREKKFQEIKSGKVNPRTADADLKDGEHTEKVDGYTWTYRVEDGGATIVAAGGKRRCTITPSPKGDVVIPAMLGGVKVTKIGREAFRGCSGMTLVTIPPNVTEIGFGAFLDCSSFAAVTIPASVAKILPRAFSGCGRLTDISVRAENKYYVSVGGVVFDKGRKMLVSYPSGVSGSYEIPSGVTHIGHFAFSGCAGLTSVTVPNSVTDIGEGAFSQSRALTSVTLGSGVKSIGPTPFYLCSRLTSIFVSEANGWYASRGGVLFSKDMKTVICCPGGFSGEYEIPMGVETVNPYAFGTCRKLTAVTIPSSVTVIDFCGFTLCEGLASVTMRGERPQEGGDNVFKSCNKLAAIHVPANCKSWAGMKEWQGIPLVFDAESK